MNWEAISFFVFLSCNLIHHKSRTVASYILFMYIYSFVEYLGFFEMMVLLISFGAKYQHCTLYLDVLSKAVFKIIYIFLKQTYCLLILIEISSYDCQTWFGLLLQ